MNRNTNHGKWDHYHCILPKKKWVFFLYVLYYNIYQRGLLCISHIFLPGTFLELNVQSLLYQGTFYNTTQRFIPCIQSQKLITSSGPGEKMFFGTPVKGGPDKKLPTKIEKTDSQLKNGWGLVWESTKNVTTENEENFSWIPPNVLFIAEYKTLPSPWQWPVSIRFPSIRLWERLEGETAILPKETALLLFRRQRKFLLHIFIINKEYFLLCNISNYLSLFTLSKASTSSRNAKWLSKLNSL